MASTAAIAAGPPYCFQVFCNRGRCNIADSGAGDSFSASRQIALWLSPARVRAVIPPPSAAAAFLATCAASFISGRRERHQRCSTTNMSRQAITKLEDEASDGSGRIAKKKSMADIQRSDLWHMPKDVSGITSQISLNIQHRNSEEESTRRDLIVLPTKKHGDAITKATNIISKGTKQKDRIVKIMSIGRKNWARDVLSQRSSAGIRAFRYRSGMRDLRNAAPGSRRKEKRHPRRKRIRFGDLVPKVSIPAIHTKKGFKRVRMHQAPSTLLTVKKTNMTLHRSILRAGKLKGRGRSSNKR